MNKEDKKVQKPRGPAGRMNPGEKPKDLKSTIKKLFYSLKEYKLLIIGALILSFISSILSIVGPDKLKDLTNEISKGLQINKENLVLVTSSIQSDFENNFILDENSILLLNEDEREEYYKVLNSLKEENSNKQQLISSLSDNTKLLMLTDTVINGVNISKQDKLEIMSLSSDNILTKLNSLSPSINELLKSNINFNIVKTIGLTLVIIYLFSAIFSYFENYLMVIVSNSFASSLRSKISVKINKLPLKYFDGTSYGDILSRVTNDVDTINMSLHNTLGELVASIALILGSLFMMFKTNVILALTSISASIIGFIFVSVIAKVSQKYFVERQRELGKLNGHIEEIYSSQIIVKVYNGTKNAQVKFDEYNNGVYNANRKSQFLAGIMGPMMGFIGNFGYVCVCVVGSILVVKGAISFGVIVAFIMYVRLFSSPLTQMAQCVTNLLTASAASERVFEFLEEKEMSTESEFTKKLDKNKVEGNIEFNHVKFGYDEDKLIIKDFSANIKKGQKVAIVGPTGAGKTTMVNLLMKFYEINSGDIKIDGVSTKELTRENIHDLFIMVLQDTWLFNGTIRDNIKFNKGHVSDEEIWNALKVVGIDHFVKTLPKMLNYQIEDNESISGGQKQLLTIARGMIEDSPFLILDEATSNVDTRTEELVQKAMDKLMENRTSFIIAHRLSTIKNADLILVMKDGNIIETGTHDELLKKNGFYAELYNSQFQN